MSIWKDTSVTGWGRVKRATSQAARPERMRDMSVALASAAQSGTPLCAYGAGRSYGDCALNTGGATLLTERLDRILGFDEVTGIVQVEPGVTFRRLLEVFLPKGWLFPVTPGTGFATIGGAVANDVHGKNHEHMGSFGQHVIEIDLITPGGQSRTISPAVKPDWFKATVGGIGLTGIVSRIALRMMRVPGPQVLATERRISDLDNYLAAFEASAGAAYSVGWIDALARGRALGRGILETAEPAPNEAHLKVKQGPAVPFDMPGFALNSLSVAAFNELYFRRVPNNAQSRLRLYGEFLYPLDSIGNWNRIYGKRGFHQFQCVVPLAQGQKALAMLLEAIAKSRAASFLAVLKRMGAGRAGYLSFPMPGYTLALDFPNASATAELYARLVRIVLDHGGRIYLAKDSLLSADDFAAMYQELPEFRAALGRIDPEGRMNSDMARRLRIRETL